MPGVNWEMEAKVGLRAVRASRPQHPRVDCTPGSPGEVFTDDPIPPQAAETGFRVSLGNPHLSPNSVITPSGCRKSRGWGPTYHLVS